MARLRLDIGLALGSSWVILAVSLKEGWYSDGVLFVSE